MIEPTRVRVLAPDVSTGLRERVSPSQDDPPMLVEVEQFYRTEMPRVIRFLMSCGADVYVAEDAAQHAFMLLYTRWETVHAPAPWVRTVALRQFLRDRRIADEKETLEPAHQPAVPPASAYVELCEETRAVLAELNQLPVAQRAVFALHYDQFGTSEISEMLKMTEPAVRKNLERARSRLRERLTFRPAVRSDWQAA